LPNGDPVFLSIHIATYASRKRPEIQPAQPLAENSGPIVWRGKMEAGYWLGVQYIKAPEDEVPITFHYEPPYEGEIDIQLHMGLLSSPPIDDLTQLASEISTSILAYVNLSLGELATPVAPIQLRELKEGRFHFESGVVVAVRERRNITDDIARNAIHHFTAIRAVLSPFEARALGVATRRYLSSITETDDVDRYCDLWESCEFSTMFEKAKGGKVGKIARALTSHLNDSGVVISKAQLKRELRIKELYQTRGDVVHNAIDTPKDFREKTSLLEAITSELLRYRFGLPCLMRGRIAEILVSCFHGTPTPNPAV